MKKLIVITLVMCLILGLTQASVVFAKQQADIVDEEIIEEYAEITDPEELLERAKKGITDKVIDKNSIKSVSKNYDTGEEVQNSVYGTTQLLKVTKDKKTQKVSRYYKTTVIALATYSRSVNTSTDPDAAKGYTGDVAAYSTIYYKDAPDSEGVPHTQLYKTTGYWKILTGNISLRYPSAIANAAGTSSYTGTTWKYDLTYSIPSTQIFSPGFSWSYSNLKPVFCESLWNLSSQTNIQVTRGTSVWTLKLVNALNGVVFR